MPEAVLDAQSAAAEQFIANARAIAPKFRERAEETESLRTLPPDSVAELIDAGFARALVPKRFGGLQLGWDAAFEALRVIGAADASHAWCAGVMVEMSHFCSFMHPDAQAALWSDGPDVPIASSALPAAEITADGDGFRVSGRSPWTSGINHAQWALLAGMLQTPEGPQWTLALLPAADYSILDTWSTIGMRGTGTNTVLTDNVYVPRTHVIGMANLRDGHGPGSDWHDAHVYRLPWLSYGPLAFLTPMLGATQGAFAAFRDWTRSRVTKSGAAMADLPTIQVKMAKAAADIDAAELLLRRVVGLTLGPELPTLEVRARSMRDFNYCGRRLLDAIEAVMSMSGSAGFSESNHIQRAWRDVHFMSTHISMNDANPVHWARLELGLGLQPNQFSY